MNRRRFLKYAGATSVAVGASAFGLDYFELKPTQSTSTITTLTSTISSMLSASSSTLLDTTQTITTANLPSLELGPKDLGGYVFHDYNGNGSRDLNEPVTDDVQIVAEGYYNTYKASPKDGAYVFRNLQSDSYRIYPVHQQNKFRYMCRSNQDIVETRVGYRLDFQAAQRVDFALMEGLLTLPLQRSTRLREEAWYVDLDPGLGVVDWKGGRHCTNRHMGIDYLLPEGTPIVAPAPGTVIEAVGSWPNVPTDPNLGLYDSGNTVAVSHPVQYGNDGWGSATEFLTIYAHLKSIHPSIQGGSKVSRGQVIAYSGNTGALSKGPHLHFQCGGFGQYHADPYRDIYHSKHLSWQYSNSLSYWTVDNKPQYSV